MPNETWTLSRHKNVWVSLKLKLYMDVTGELKTLAKDDLLGHTDRDPATPRMDVLPDSPCTLCALCVEHMPVAYLVLIPPSTFNAFISLNITNNPQIHI